MARGSKAGLRVPGGGQPVSPAPGFAADAISPRPGRGLIGANAYKKGALQK